jgi:hypothetical protein
MLGRAKRLVHIWCFGNCRKLKFLESRGVTVDVHHGAHVNVMSSNLIAVGNPAISDLEPLSDELHEKIAECYDGEAKDYIRGPY